MFNFYDRGYFHFSTSSMWSGLLRKQKVEFDYVEKDLTEELIQ